MSTDLRRLGTSTNCIPPLPFPPGDTRLSEDLFADTLSESLGLARVRIAGVHIAPEALRVLTRRVARQYVCLPLEITKRKITLAMADPQDILTIDAVQFASNRRVQPVVASRREILEGIDKHYPEASSRISVADANVFTFLDGGDSVELEDAASEPSDAAAIVSVCDQILLDAVNLDASDIHIEPGPDDVRIRLRVDGVLRDYLDLPGWMKTQLLSRIKVLAHLDIAQQRLPQDGRIQARLRDRAIDVRVSTLPTQYGEKIVLRVLGSSLAPSLVELGLAADHVQLINDALHQPQGLVLVTGPTGSGKSTTLYSMLTRRQSPDINMVTIEDPIERRLPGISQSQINDKAGTTFASYLRAILRQDPDVIMVGEIRDLESAEIAFQAGLTGHLVLSTLHTNNTTAAIDRLLDIGVQPSMITSVITLIAAQRLARLICPHCRVQYRPSGAALAKLGMNADMDFVRGNGCAACGHTGYRGRIAIAELLRLTPAMKQLIRDGASEAELSAAAAASGMRSLRDDGVAKVRAGLTTVEEVLRVIRIDDEASEVATVNRRISGARTLTKTSVADSDVATDA